MGVSGTGKTTLAGFIAEKFSVELMEADDFHPPENSAHMALGQGLTDAMREPWLKSMCDHIRVSDGPLSLAYSGLKHPHRERFRCLGPPVIFLHLQGDFDVIHQRMNNRVGHFFPATLLKIQYDDLDDTTNESDIISIDVNGDLSSIFHVASRAVDNFLNQ